jgi:hypothetical protein
MKRGSDWSTLLGVKGGTSATEVTVER